MKLSLFVAALAATVVSALPTNSTNTPLTDVALKKRANCRETTLDWTAIYYADEIINTFNFKIDYNNV
ncbi:hypothetical protein BGW39_002845 [Mortierella sp. 14UC]|nr:hypothetical protein BGW39_002845 [Mortierella sp. 14UC]